MFGGIVLSLFHLVLCVMSCWLFYVVVSFVFVRCLFVAFSSVCMVRACFQPLAVGFCFASGGRRHCGKCGRGRRRRR